MRHFNLLKLVEEQEKAGTLYNEFLKVAEMSAGIYQLKAGSADLQHPHTEDEVYYIIKGKSDFQIGNDIFQVCSSSFICK